MNAPLSSIAPANAVQPAAANQQDAAAPEVPFSQVLSGEMAQRHASETSPEDDVRDAAPLPSGDIAVVVDDATMPIDDALADITAAATDPVQTDTAPTLPDAMLALALHPDLLKPAPAPAAQRAGVDLTEAPTAIDSRSAGKRAANPSQFGVDAAQTNAQAASKTDPTPATNQATASRLPETAQIGDRLPDFMSAMTAAQAPQIAATLAKVDTGERLTPSVGTTAWGQALGEKVVWMATGGQQTASLTLNPPDLGPLQVVVNVTNDQATANFFAAQPEVRQALEAALPRLRDMMQDAGIQLGQATVSADTPRQQDASERGPQRIAQPFMGTGESNETDHPLTGMQRLQAGRGLVDTFA
jgi:flagellar hook-length control protein FliK